MNFFTNKIGGVFLSKEKIRRTMGKIEKSERERESEIKLVMKDS